MIRRILLSMTLLMLAAGLATGQNRPEQVHQNVSNAISTASKVQERADEWNWEKQGIIQEIRTLKQRITWNQYRQERFRVYIERVKEEIANLEFAKDELYNLRYHLDPYLEEVVKRMEAFVADDLPFLENERERRIASLRASLDNYTLPLSEKMRQVFSVGLQAETMYGNNIEALEDITLEIDGVATDVDILRLGRVALIYMSLDQTRIGRWNHQNRQWEPLPGGMLRDVRIAMDMAKRRRPAGITDLPIGEY